MKRIIYLSLLFFWSCEENIEEDYITYDCLEIKTYYEESVVSIMNNNCTSCHSGQSGSGGLSLDTFDGVVEGIMNGAVIERINLDISSPYLMPPGSEQLSEQELNVIQDFSEILCQ